MVLGAVWYTPVLFGRQWLAASGRTEEEVAEGPGIGYVLAAIAALVISYALARVVRWAEVDDLWNGALVGLLAWLGFVATTSAVNTFFAGRPRALYLIDAGYYLVSFLVVGAIHGVWD